MIRLFKITAFLTFLLLSSCSENAEDMKNVLPFDNITFELNCGWCASGQSIKITKDNKVEYFQTYPCSPENNIKKERLLTEEEIQQINEKFKLVTFLSIDLDQCGQCYDGCDDVIRVVSINAMEHQIRYDQFDEYSELLAIEELVETLLKIRSSF